MASAAKIGEGRATAVVLKGQNRHARSFSEPIKEASSRKPLPMNGQVVVDHASLSSSEDASVNLSLSQDLVNSAGASSPQASSAEAPPWVSDQSDQSSNASALEDLCDKLADVQKERRLAIRSQNRIDGATLAFIRERLGFHTGLEKAERERLSRRARAIKSALEQKPDDYDPFMPIVASCQKSREPWDELRVAAEKHIEKLAKGLPAQKFVKNLPGFSLKTLGVIAAEAGDLCRYPKIGHLRKRLGVAVIDGKRQSSVPQGLSREERREAWKKRGYNAQRRSEIYVFIEDTGVFRHQGPDSKYRQYYEKKKAEYLERGWGKKHADVAARRAMAQMVIKHLWQTWREEAA